jgi:hypothetical protein
MSEPIHAYLIVNARYHDTDFARLEILKLLSETSDVRTRVAQDFSDLEAIAQADFLITYTCDLRPTEEEALALRAFVSSGGRWIALHGTNAILEIGAKGMYCPREHTTFMETLGSRFISHPPSMPYTVTVSDPSHPLVAGLDSFETEDELYLCEYYGEIKPLLQTRFTGTFQSGYVENEWPDDEPRLVAYTHPVGDIVAAPTTCALFNPSQKWFEAPGKTQPTWNCCGDPSPGAGATSSPGPTTQGRLPETH